MRRLMLSLSVLFATLILPLTAQIRLAQGTVAAGTPTSRA